ncbi:oxygen-independent coproporphyrinogen-3 oxidase [Lysobacter sp. yr284]|uniref:coproporphyrinogen-III oxidase family protein n=1 Tax=Lysobacter sp. yr284 TaxID=1761791 RepID=UPI0008964948|nr:coproporphyrinogen-III oxidase family protein [Lysobacter sp. yr284]SDZ01484.1 oxygen-independent coproporphyrinogen-3 oxidase [Lysobacter sp. yr284]
MEPLKIALLDAAPPPQAEAPADYRGEAPNRNGFVVAWPPQRYWKSASETDLSSEKPLHLYFHIPYCLQRCRYCFYKIEILSESSHAQRERYVSALCREIELVADAHRLRGRAVRSIYFGGGTPSVIPPEQLARIKRTIEECFRLDDPEFVFEIEPITLNNRMIDGLANLGVNRISFGIQSFDDRVVALTGRHDTDEKNSRAIERALQTGAVVNVDLLAGLEGETMGSWQHSIDRAIALGVHAVTVYKMELYSNAHYMSEIRQGKLSLPSEDEEMAFARWGLDRLRDNGYSPSTYFTFTREGKYPQHHIISRWRGEDLYGFGASAFGTVAGQARQNVSEIGVYLERVESGRIPTQRVLELSSADHMMRDLVMGLKTTLIDLDEYRRRHGLRLDHVLADDIAHLSREGLVAVEDGRLRLTDEGIVYGDYSGRYLGAGLRRVFTGDARPLRA